MSFFLLWTLNTMHLFFRGLSVNILIAAFETISGHLKHIFWLPLTHLPCFDPCSCEIDLSLFIYFIIILFLGDTNSPYQPWLSKLYHITLAIQIVGCFFVEVGRFWWAFGLKIINPIWQHCDWDTDTVRSSGHRNKCSYSSKRIQLSHWTRVNGLSTFFPLAFVVMCWECASISRRIH